MSFEAEQEEADPRPNTVFQTIKVIALIVAGIFCLGYAFGGLAAVFENGYITFKNTVSITGALAIAAICGFGIKSLGLLPNRDEPVAPSTRKSNQIMGLSLAFGFVIGVLLSINAVIQDSAFGIFSDPEIHVGIALALTLAWLIFLPWIGIVWHRTVDEIEMAANAAGAIVAFYAYGLVVPIWWICERAGLLPPQHPMFVFVIVISVYSVVWWHKRS